jgi:TusA-related sulfurtransferase
MAAAADLSIDCVGLFCPVPVLRTREALRGLRPGQVLAVTADDPAAEADMVRFAARAGQELLEIGRDGQVFRFLVRKTA